VSYYANEVEMGRFRFSILAVSRNRRFCIPTTESVDPDSYFLLIKLQHLQFLNRK